MSALSIIKKELNNIKSLEVKNIDVGPIDENDLFNQIPTIIDFNDLPYEGGIVHLRIRFPTDFSFKSQNFQLKKKFINIISL